MLIQCRDIHLFSCYYCANNVDQMPHSLLVCRFYHWCSRHFFTGRKYYLEFYLFFWIYIILLISMISLQFLQLLLIVFLLRSLSTLCWPLYLTFAFWFNFQSLDITSCTVRINAWALEFIKFLLLQCLLIL